MASTCTSRYLRLPEVSFQPNVKGFLETSFCSAKAIAEVGEDVCRDRWINLLKSLSYPPAYTVLRVTTLHHTKTSIKKQLNDALQQQYRMTERLPPEVHDDDILDDILVITPSTLHVSCMTPMTKEVIVDLQCGLAVLRGADIYAPGVMAAAPDMVQDDRVSVYVDVRGTCRRGLTRSFEGDKVFVGNGTVAMSRKELFAGVQQPRGVAVKMTAPLFDCPSLNGILADKIFLQNLPSVVVGHVTNPQPGSRVLDMCAAPGGKTTHLACLMKDEGVLIALDKSQSKINKVQHNAQVLGISCIQAYVYDSTKACCKGLKKTSSNAEIAEPPYPPETFDCILLDAPCSGLGQRPQICNQLQLNEIKSYPAYQRQFITTAVELLRPGGTLVYSTCTITLAENEGMVEWVISTYPQLKLSQQVPHVGGVGLEGTSLDPNQLSLLQRFHPVSAFSAENQPNCHQDTIGFFIAKFIKCLDSEQSSIKK